MKASKVRDMTKEELVKRGQDVREEMFRLRFQHATGQLENPVRLRILRRDLAQVLTILHEKDAAAKEAPKTVNEKAG